MPHVSPLPSELYFCGIVVDQDLNCSAEDKTNDQALLLQVRQLTARHPHFALQHLPDAKRLSRHVLCVCNGPGMSMRVLGLVPCSRHLVTCVWAAACAQGGSLHVRPPCDWGLLPRLFPLTPYTYCLLLLVFTVTEVSVSRAADFAFKQAQQQQSLTACAGALSA